jgi:L-ribulokinase
MSPPPRARLLPDAGRAAAYDLLFAEYLALHDHFGRSTPTMHRLQALRREVRDRRAR